MGWCGPAREGAALCILALLSVSVSWHLALSMDRNPPLAQEQAGFGEGLQSQKEAGPTGQGSSICEPSPELSFCEFAPKFSNRQTQVQA